MISNNSDPMIYSSKELGFDLSKYSKIEIRCKWDIPNVGNKQHIGFYFTTDTDKTWNEAKHVGTNVVPSSGGKYQTISFNMAANSNWTGTLDQLRFDPFNAKGTIEVCKNGSGVDFSEEKAKEILLENEIEILVNLNDGEFSATAWGCDLTYDYVKINGDYRT